MHETPVYDRYRLRPGDTVEGPAIVEEREATTVIGPGDRLAIDDAWKKNDSIVNTISMRAPSGSAVRFFDGQPRKGIWQDLGTWTTWDHMDIIGQTRMWNLLDGRNPKDFYLEHAALLERLP